MRVPADRVQVVLEAVDDRFDVVVDRDMARRVAERDFGIHRDYVLYVSNLWLYKNPDGAIRAFARLWSEYGDDLDLVLAGPDDYGRTAELRALAARLGVGDRVRFIGRVEQGQLVQLYAAARLVFYPSLAETFGKPAIEAMRSGVPLVAASATSLPEIVGDAGLLVDPGDDAAMARALHEAAVNEPLRRELIERGLRRGATFSWAAVARSTLRVCVQAAERHHRSRYISTRDIQI
jgi:glycosyltransferase involved in cell wall biosynthesis